MSQYLPEVIVSDGLPADTILVVPGPRRMVPDVDPATGESYRRLETLEEYARRCVAIRGIGPCVRATGVPVAIEGSTA